jgi:hypothetical protein
MTKKPDVDVDAIEPVCTDRIFGATLLILVGAGVLFVTCQNCDLSAPPPRPIPATPERFATPPREAWPPAPWREGPMPHLDNPHNHGQKWRYIHGEKVPADHSPDDHDWDEFDHGRDQCMDDDRDMMPGRKR